MSWHGYAMVTLLIGMSIMGVMLSVALPLWETVSRREREAELVFRGEQYVQAIRLFQRRYAGTFPPSVDVLLQQRLLRRRYKDPITLGEFRVLHAGTGPTSAAMPDGEPGGAAPGQPSPPPGAGAPRPATRGHSGIIGVVSTSPRTSLRVYKGRGRYNQWMFVATESTTQVRAPGVASERFAHGGSRRDTRLPDNSSAVSPGRSRLAPLPPFRGRGLE